MMIKTMIPFLLLASPGFAQNNFEQFSARPETIENIKKRPSRGNPRDSKIEIKTDSQEKSIKNSNFRSQVASPRSGNRESEVFGRETVKEKEKKEKKYVNLNPETAFGPEIIEGFDFPDTDITEITKHMQKLTGINLILDKNIKGKVSISAPTAITVGDAWKAYLVALNMAGFSLVKTGEFYRIINSRDIRYTSSKIYTGEFVPNVENYMMKIISLKHVDASQIVRNFRPFMSRYGRILDIGQTNTIIINDTGTNINRLIKLVQSVDIPGFQESMQIIPVQNTSAQELAKLLDSILKEERGSTSRRSTRRSKSSRDSGTNGANISKIIAEPRTNSIIAMANSSGIKHLKTLISKLDVETASNGSGKIQVYYLKYGNAEELSTTLSALISNARSGNSSARSGGAASRVRARTSRTNQQSNASGTIFNEEVRVTADQATNSLVVTASPTDWLTVKQVIAKLDIPRDQVYVEGLIVETKVDQTREVGTNYAGLYGEGIAEKAGFGATSILSLADPTQIPAGFFAGFGLGGKETVTFGTGTNATEITASPINALIKAAVSNSNTNILATPQIMVMDNTEGTFEVGSKVPYLVSQPGAGGFNQPNTEFQDIKMKIKIKPQINKATRFIKMEIDQSISDVSESSRLAGATSNVGGVATDDRSVITQVVVRDRDTIAMGGLLRNKITDVESKIPILGDIPVLGWLFKNKNKNKEKVNMIFFLTPKIISPYEQTASQNTLDVIAARNKAVGDTKLKFDHNRKKIDEITKKVEQQRNGPLFSDQQAKLYDNSQTEVGAPTDLEAETLTIDDVDQSANDTDEEYVDFGSEQN